MQIKYDMFFKLPYSIKNKNDANDQLISYLQSVVDAFENLITL